MPGFDPEIPVSTATPPPEGVWPACLVDVCYRMQKYQDKEPKPSVKLIWELDEVNPETNEPYLASQIFSFTMSAKGNLAKMLEGWRGRPFTDEERKTLRLSTLVRMIGAPCKIMIAHEARADGSVWGNIVKVSAVLKKDGYQGSGKYKRSQKDNDEELKAIAASSQQSRTPGVMAQGESSASEEDAGNGLPF